MIVPYITLSTWHHRYALATRPNTLPSVIRSPKDFAVCYELFLWHSWWFLPSDCFFNHHWIARAYVHPHVPNWGGEKLPRPLVVLPPPLDGDFPFLCLVAQFLMWDVLMIGRGKITWTSRNCIPHLLQSSRYFPAAGRGPAS